MGKEELVTWCYKSTYIHVCIKNIVILKMSLHVSISKRKAKNCDNMRWILKHRRTRVQTLVGKPQELQRATAGPQIFLTCWFTNHQRLNSVNETWEAEELLVSEVALPCSCREHHSGSGSNGPCSVNWESTEKTPNCPTTCLQLAKNVTVLWASEKA